MSMKRFSGMPADLQKIMADAAKVGADTETELYNKFDAQSLVVLAKDHGMQIDKVDREKFRARMKPVFDRYQDRVGKDLIDQVTKLGA
jgi:TRAP-type C4-dicarboxylate transport system substrate-binding protein